VPRLLLIDDDRFLLRALENLLSAEGYFCQAAVTAEEARAALRGEPFDMVILDVGLPDQDGISLCRQIRTRHRMPILMLSARGDNADKVVGLEVGADDYLTKPFMPRELIARVRAQLRRALEYSQPSEPNNQIAIGSLLIDMDSRDALCAGRPAHLTGREFALLHFLARHRNRALATEWIFENVWGYGAALGVKTLAVFVRRVRCKIEADPENPRFLQTVRGYGYKLTDGSEPLDQKRPL
jgi:two-component system response regulator VicR